MKRARLELTALDLATLTVQWHRGDESISAFSVRDCDGGNCWAQPLSTMPWRQNVSRAGHGVWGNRAVNAENRYGTFNLLLRSALFDLEA